MRAPSRPSYDLAEVQRLVREGSYRVTGRALNDAGDLGFDGSDICDCVLALTPAAFYKTMASEMLKGVMQDVYRPTYLGLELYVKVQLHPPTQAVVISFKKR